MLVMTMRLLNNAGFGTIGAGYRINFVRQRSAGPSPRECMKYMIADVRKGETASTQMPD